MPAVGEVYTTGGGTKPMMHAMHFYQQAQQEARLSSVRTESFMQIK